MELGEAFGARLTDDWVASAWGLTWQQLYALDANTVFSKLRLEQAKAAYHRRLAEQHRENRKS